MVVLILVIVLVILMLLEIRVVLAEQVGRLEQVRQFGGYEIDIGLGTVSFGGYVEFASLGGWAVLALVVGRVGIGLFFWDVLGLREVDIDLVEIIHHFIVIVIIVLIYIINL